MRLTCPIQRNEEGNEYKIEYRRTEIVHLRSGSTELRRSILEKLVEGDPECRILQMLHNQ